MQVLRKRQLVGSCRGIWEGLSIFCSFLVSRNALQDLLWRYMQEARWCVVLSFCLRICINLLYVSLYCNLSDWIFCFSNLSVHFKMSLHIPVLFWFCLCGLPTPVDYCASVFATLWTSADLLTLSLNYESSRQAYLTLLDLYLSFSSILAQIWFYRYHNRSDSVRITRHLMKSMPACFKYNMKPWYDKIVYCCYMWTGESWFLCRKTVFEVDLQSEFTKP